jgi:hypothetical protein
MAEQYYPRPILLYSALDLLELEGKGQSGEGHTAQSASNANILANSSLYSKQLQGMDQGLGGRVLIKKNPQAKFLKCCRICGNFQVKWAENGSKREIFDECVLDFNFITIRGMLLSNFWNHFNLVFSNINSHVHKREHIWCRNYIEK